VSLRITIASADSDLRLGLHIGLLNVLPTASVSAVASATELLATVTSMHPDVIAVDLRLTEDPGGFVAEVRSSSATSSIVAIGDDSVLAGLPSRVCTLLIPTRTAPRALIAAIAEVSTANG
jgi:hypothetical protein